MGNLIFTIDEPVELAGVEYWYRYDTYHKSWTNETIAELYLYEVLRHTPKGVFIRYWGEKFVLKDARKRWCYPTKADALNSFIIRKQWMIRHLETSLHRTKAALAHAEAKKADA